MTDLASPHCPDCGAAIGNLVGGACPYCRAPLVAIAYGAPAAFPEAGGGAGTSVVLNTVGDRMIQVIKVVREHTGLGLKEAKALVDGARTGSQTIATNLAPDQARSFADALRHAGANADAR